MSTDAFGLWWTAKARIAPTATRIRLTGMPTPGLCPLRVHQERARDARVVSAPTVASGRVFLQRPQGKTAADHGRDDLAQAARALVEVALAPVHQPVDTESDGMLLEEQQVAALTERRGDAAKPRLEVAHDRERAQARVDEVEASAAELPRQGLRIGLHPENRRPPFPRG